MKKILHSLPLLVAIVMMAMSPMKMWADDLSPLTAAKCTQLGLDAKYVGYYAIGSANDLAWFRDYVNTGNVDANAVLTANINMSSVCHAAAEGVEKLSWTPIANNENGKFTGVFDGNNKTISNLYINETAKNNMALFGQAAEDAEIMNLTVNGNVTAKNKVALILACAKDSIKLTNCKSEGAVNGEQNIGGIVGYIGGNNDTKLTITECKNTATIISNYGGRAYVGGIAGCAYDVNMSKCTNDATVSAEGYYVGGIAGFIDADDSDKPLSISECHNTGAIKTTYNSGACVGGIAGYACDVIMSKCTNEATVTADGYIVGGIAGNLHSDDGNYPSSVSECQNAGAVTSTRNSDSYAGGIAGYAYDVIMSKCTNEATVTAAGYYVGGILGGVDANQDIMLSSISECQNTGAIISTCKDGAYTGGIVGDAYDVNISKCTNEATVTVDGYDVGGIVGWIKPDNSDYILSISECTNKGAVTSTYDDGDVYAGGIAGNADYVNISKCTNESTVTAAGSGVGGIVGCNEDVVLTECSNSGDITSTYNDYANVGGIVGEWDNEDRASSMVKCHNTGVITARSYIGGLVGYVNYPESLSTISECYNSGKVISTYVNDGAYAGGLVGYISAYEININKCYNAGDIEAAGYYVGGLFGYVEADGEIINCYNTGNISSTTTNGNAYIGGVAYELGDDDDGLIVENVYSSATISVNPTAQCVAGFASYIYSGVTVKNGFYDKDKAPLPFYSYLYNDNQLTDSEGKTSAEFASGEIAYLFNGSTSQGTEKSPLVWYQVVGSETYPTFEQNQYAIVKYSEAEGYYNDIENIGNYTFEDGTAYDAKVKHIATSLTYTRTFANTTFNALYLPFSMSYSDWSDKADVYRLLNIFEEDNNNDGTIDEWILKVVKLKSGERTKANTLYVIKPKTKGDMEITLADVTLDLAKEKSYWCASLDYKFVFTGTYAEKTINDDSYFFMSTTGGLQYAAEDLTLKPQRWYMGIYDKDTDQLVNPSTFNPQAAPAKAIRIVCDEDNIATGISQMENGECRMENGKYIENGRIVIIKNGVKHNISGQSIK